MTVTARSREIAKGLAAAAVLAGLVVGLPVVLVVLVGWPLPTPASMPSWAEIQLALAGGSPPPTAVLNTVAIGLWIVWARLCAAVGTEAVRLARSRPAADLPAARRIAARLLAAAALLAPTGQTAASTGLKAAAAAGGAAAVHQSAAVADPAPSAGASPGPEEASATPAGQQQPEPGQQLYTIQRGDSLWLLAEDHLGDGNRWTEIDDVNVGRRVEPTTRYTAETHKQGLQPGWQLAIPTDGGGQQPAGATVGGGGQSAATTPSEVAEETAAVSTGGEDPEQASATQLVEATTADKKEQAPTADEPGREVVDRGEHFWGIAEEALAEAWGRPPLNHEITRYWTQLVDANEGRLAPPHDPDLIYPDQEFKLPPVPADPTPGGRFKGTAAGGPAPTGTQGGTGSQADGSRQSAGEAAGAGQDSSGGEAATGAQAGGQNGDSQHSRTSKRRSVGPLAGLLGGNLVPSLAPFANGDGNRPGGQGGGDEEAADAPTTSASTSASGDSAAAAGAHRPGPPAGVGGLSGAGAGPQRVPAGPATAGGSDTDRPGADSREAEAGAAEAGVPLPAKLAGGGLLLFGLVGAIDRMRRRQLRQRPTGTRPPRPGPEAAEVEIGLRAGADPDTAKFVDLGLLHLGAGLVDRVAAPPAIVGAAVDDQALSVELAGDDRDPPVGWETIEDGGLCCWRLDRPDDLEQLRPPDGRAVPAPLPALVTVACHTSGAKILLNLEYVGVLSVHAGEDTEAVMRTLVVELATSPAGAGVQIICVGFAEELQALERVRTVDDFDEVAGRLAADSTRIEEALDGHTGGPLAGRLAHPAADTLLPTLVFAPGDIDGRLLQAAGRTAHAGPVAIVGGAATDTADGGWDLHVDGDQAHIPQLFDYSLTWPGLSDQQLGAAAELLEVAASSDYQPANTDLLGAAGSPPGGAGHGADGDTEQAPSLLQADPPAGPSDNGHPTTAASPAPTRTANTDADADGSEVEAGREPAVDVQVLGPVRISGLDKNDWDRKKVPELLVYLALNPDGSSSDVLLDRLWAGRNTSLRTMQNVVSDARTALGQNPDGGLYIPQAGKAGRYHLRGAGCDLHRLHAHLDTADAADSQQAADGHLRAALELVRGELFSDVGSGYDWVDPYYTKAVVAIEDAACRLTELCLAVGDHGGARWAARQGLQANPGSESVGRARMRVAADAGNRSELDQVYSELCSVASRSADQPNGSDRLLPETTELYTQLRRQLSTSQTTGPDETDPARTHRLVESIVDEAAN